MSNDQEIIIGADADGAPVALPLRMANRHGLIAGATGTGKTVTLQTLAQSFSRAGIPVFTADIKGDLSGLAAPANLDAKLTERFAKLGNSTPSPQAAPVVFWDILGENGVPLRSTISEMGPVLLGRILDLNPTQCGVLQIAFSLADDEGLLLIDTKDLRALLSHLADNASEIQKTYGNVSKASIGTIQRSLLVLEEAGGERFFGEPAISLQSLMQTDFSGNGVISVLDATKLVRNPKIYSTFLLWLLSELFEELPEAGDVEKPKLVFFFDEAHLLFKDCDQSLLEKIEQVIRLVRSKGVGIYFVTQSPLDVPESVLGQLGHKIQHALRAFTPKDQKAVRTAAATFRENPAFDTFDVITQLAIGEALVSFLDRSGVPRPVVRTSVLPPLSRMGPLSDDERLEIVRRSPMRSTYEAAVDRDSAHEMLARRVEQKSAASADGSSGQAQEPKKKPSSNRQGTGEAFLKSVVRSIGSSLGREIMRGMLGSILGGGSKGRSR